MLNITFTFAENIDIYHNQSSLIVPVKTPIITKKQVTVTIYPQIVISRTYDVISFHSVSLFLFQIFSAAWKFIKKETLAQLFSCEFCKIFKNAFFYRTSQVFCF